MAQPMITTDSGGLAKLLAAVRTAAATDDLMPGIAGVLLHTTLTDAGVVLAATATDRYMALHGHLPASGPLWPAPVWLTSDQVAQVLAVLHTARGGEAEVGVDGAQVVVRTAGATVHLPHERGIDFAKVLALFQLALAAAPCDVSVTVDGARLARLAQLADGRDMRVRCTGPDQPVLVQFGAHLAGLLTPARRDPAVGPVPDVQIAALTEQAEVAA